MANRLAGRVALVTGAGRGIGRAVALKLAAEGARVVANDLDDEPLQTLEGEIRRDGGHAVVYPADVTSPEFPERFIERALSTFGSLDIIVNNAGYVWNGAVHRLTDRQWEAVVDCHLGAPFRLLRAAAPVLRDQHAADQRAGRRLVRKIVTVSSIAALYGAVGAANYAAAKAGVIGLTRTLAREWGRYAVTANAVAFGLIQTRLTSPEATDLSAPVSDAGASMGIRTDAFATMNARIPLQRPGTVDEAAGAVYLLCASESDYVSGQILVCGGGLSMT